MCIFHRLIFSFSYVLKKRYRPILNGLKVSTFIPVYTVCIFRPLPIPTHTRTRSDVKVYQMSKVTEHLHTKKSDRTLTVSHAASVD